MRQPVPDNILHYSVFIQVIEGNNYALRIAQTLGKSKLPIMKNLKELCEAGFLYAEKGTDHNKTLYFVNYPGLASQLFQVYEQLLEEDSMRQLIEVLHESELHKLLEPHLYKQRDKAEKVHHQKLIDKYAYKRNVHQFLEEYFEVFVQNPFSEGVTINHALSELIRLCAYYAEYPRLDQPIRNLDLKEIQGMPERTVSCWLLHKWSKEYKIKSMIMDLSYHQAPIYRQYFRFILLYMNALGTELSELF